MKEITRVFYLDLFFASESSNAYVCLIHNRYKFCIRELTKVTEQSLPQYLNNILISFE